MKIALAEKQKLGFVDGTINVLADGTEAFEQWKRCDYMVTSWILNSISKTLQKPSFTLLLLRKCGMKYLKGLEKVMGR